MSLHTDLISAGLPVSGTAVEGTTVLFTRELTAPETLVYESIVNPVAFRKITSKADAKAIPSWSDWTPAQWAAYRDANVSATQINAIGNLADAKVVLLKMAVIIDAQAKMIIALRDHSGITD